MKRLFLMFIALFCATATWAQDEVGLTLIPPSPVTDKINLDIRAGIVNKSNQTQQYEVAIYLNKVNSKGLLYQQKQVSIPAGGSKAFKVVIPTAGKVGMNNITLKVTGANGSYTKEREIEIIGSDIRSTRLIDGAWIGIYHWCETEGKHWNQDIKKMTDDNWREMVRSMHKIGMKMIVIQELFRNQEYIGAHSTTVENYQGKAFYPSKLYLGRMEINSKDAVEAILSEADKLGMQVMMGIGMYAWFDFTPESLRWHKHVAQEVWDMYGHHESFYAFYVSEESGGSIDNWEATSEGRLKRKAEIVNFFREFKKFCNSLAPAKPVMLATNSMLVPNGADTYPALLEHLDILCPFGFARMPEGDLTGKEAADMLQKFCDDANSHLWFDLETFLFNPDNSLYPRPVEQIIHDLNLFSNFEKILCYQFPGVFNDPEMSIRIGEERTIGLFNGYKTYYEKIMNERKQAVKGDKR